MAGLLVVSNTKSIRIAGIWQTLTNNARASFPNVAGTSDRRRRKKKLSTTNAVILLGGKELFRFSNSLNYAAFVVFFIRPFMYAKHIGTGVSG